MGCEQGNYGMTAKKSLSAPETVGNYNLIEKIAEGSMGTVYKARHWETHQLVAIKILSRDIAKNPIFLKRFEQEFRVAAKLDHPNIVKVIEYSGMGDAPYIVMELVEGGSLGDQLEKSGAMTEEEAVRVIVATAQGIHYAHRQGLIHRDIKPDNILVTPDGKVKVTDLGLAKDQDANVDLTRTGRGLGTPTFMAPEQFRNAKNASIRCDVYSLGATLYQMVTGEYPFGIADPVQAMMRKLRNELTSPRQLAPKLTERVDWAIRRAMSPDANQRPASCLEFVEDLTGDNPRQANDTTPETSAGESWHLVYEDDQGSLRTDCGSSQAIRQGFQEGKYGAPGGVRASRNPSGPFEALSAFAEFRDLAMNLQPPAPKRPSHQTVPLLSQSTMVAKPTPPPEAEAPHFRLKPTRERADADSGTIDLSKILLIVMISVLATVLATKYLLPMLTTLK